MAQKEISKTKDHNHQFPDSLPLRIERVFLAPVEDVWMAWTSPEQIKQWWGPEGFSCPEAHIDFREGGKYNLAMKGPNQNVMWGGGVFEEIIPLEKIRYTDSFTDKEGNVVSASIYGMGEDFPETCYVTVSFEKLGPAETKMHLLHEGIPSAMHDDCLEGWGSSFNKLQKLVERN